MMHYANRSAFPGTGCQIGGVDKCTIITLRAELFNVMLERLASSKG